jgi:hypothetical protein
MTKVIIFLLFKQYIFKIEYLYITNVVANRLED